MSLRLRLALLVTLITLLTVACFATLAYVLFRQDQLQQLEGVLSRDLERAQALFTNPSVGRSLSSLTDRRFVQQFVTNADQVAIPSGGLAPLPLVEGADVLEIEGLPMLVSSTTWQTGSGIPLGTIRAGLDMSSAYAARRNLLRSIIISGGVITALALIAGLGLLQRALKPLISLAEQARGIDPALPELAQYEGPDDELGDLASALNASLDGIRQRQEAERASLAEIAHELAAPLTLVAGHLTALSERVDDPDLEVAKDAADELLYTSQDLLTLARGELEQSYDMRVLDLYKIVKRVAAAYKISDVSGESAQLAGSAERLTQMIRNIVRNAVQVAGADKVTIRLEVSDLHQIIIHDEGLGIAPEDVAHIFDRFYTKRGGAGVGLSVALKIAKAHGGAITVQSELGKGSEFTIMLPSLDRQLKSG